MCIFKYKKGKDQNSDEFEINTAMLLYSVDNEKSDFKLEVLFMIYNIMSKHIGSYKSRRTYIYTFNINDFHSTK